jgi:hypothetical protein
MGSPLLSKVVHNPSWEEIIAKMESKINRWTDSFIFLPGRVLLITFFLSYFSLYVFFYLGFSHEISQDCLANSTQVFSGGGGDEAK